MSLYYALHYPNSVYTAGAGLEHWAGKKLPIIALENFGQRPDETLVCIWHHARE